MRLRTSVHPSVRSLFFSSTQKRVSTSGTEGRRGSVWGKGGKGRGWWGAGEVGTRGRDASEVCRDQACFFSIFFLDAIFIGGCVLAFVRRFTHAPGYSKAMSASPPTKHRLKQRLQYQWYGSGSHSPHPQVLNIWNRANAWLVQLPILQTVVVPVDKIELKQTSLSNNACPEKKID